MDVVYRVRYGEHNEPLRYSLRSLSHVLHGRVFIAGYKPSWVTGVVYLPRDQSGYSDQENSNANLRLAVRNSHLSREFVLMDDDFYIMDPVEDIPDMHQGPLDSVIARYKLDNRFGQAHSLIRTRDWLKQHDFHGLLSYELHMPMVMDKQAAQDMFENVSLPLFALRPRTLYGNLYSIHGEFTADAKDASNPEAQRFFSSGDFESVRGKLAARFPTRSQFES